MPARSIGARGPRRDDGESRRRRATIGLVTGLAVLLSGALAPDPARAGTYVMRNCSVPGHPNAPLRPWTAGGRSNTTVVDACADGGGVSFSFPGTHEMSPGYGSGVGLARPATGPQSEIRLVKTSLWYTARLRGPGPGVSVFAYENHSADTHVPWLVAGPPGAENLSFEQQFSATTQTYSVAITCGPAWGPHTPEPCVPEHKTPFHVRGMEVTLSEDTPPTVLPLQGTLLAGGAQSGVRTLSYAATDPQSGLAKVDVLLGDIVVKRHDLAPRCFYSDFTVCPASDDETLEIDTAAVPNGSYRLAVRVRDAAGNERVAYGERPVEVANEPAPPTTNVPGRPVPGATSGASGPGPGVASEPALGTTSVLPCTIAATFKGISGRTLTVPYGRRVSVQGRLAQGLQPTAGASIQVLERPDRRGAPEKLTRAVMTKADGSFSIGLPTSRPSRVVRFACRPTGGVQVVSQALRLRVRAASTLRASLRGVVVRFKGRVRSGPMPKRGKRVQLEGRSPGSAWTPFRTLRTDRKGGFSGTYRLRVRRPGVTLKIRAVVPSENGYGYAGSRSRAVTLRVR